MLKNHFKIAWRNLYAQKMHSLINIGGLAVSMAVAILILLWIQNEFRYDSYHNDADRIFLLAEYDTQRDNKASELSPYVLYSHIKQDFPEVEVAAAAQRYTRQIFEVDNRPFHEPNALYVDSNWLKLFQYEVIEGDLNVFKHANSQVIITESKAKQYFGSQPALGQVIYIDSIPATVGAVIRDIPTYSTFKQDILIPTHYYFGDEYDRDAGYWGAYSSLLFVKLVADADPTATSEKITNLFRNNQTWRKEHYTYHRLVPLVDLHLSTDFRGGMLKHGNITTIRIFFILAALLLLTACVNFVNLSIARVSLRSKEIGVRKIIGADKRQLFGQIMVETGLAISLSMAFALFFVRVLLPYFNAFTEIQFTFNPLDPPVLLLLTSVFLFVLALTGIYPALLMATLKPINLFRGKALLSLKQDTLKRILMTTQLALAVAMIVGVMTIYRQFDFIQQQTDAYKRQQVFKLVAHPTKVRGHTAIEAQGMQLQRIKNDLLSSSAIKHVAKTNGVSMLDDKWQMTLEKKWIGYPEQEEPSMTVVLWVDHDYLAIAEFDILSGRWFDPENPADDRNILVNETAVKAFGLKEPVVGTMFTDLSNHQGTIIGVVKDFYHKSVHERIDPVIIELDQHQMGHAFLVEAHAGRVQDAVQAASKIWGTYYADKPFEYTFLDESFDRLYKEDRKALMFSMIFAGLSILISCLGLLGMAMFSMQQRTKEIGIRKVLGASVVSITRMLTSSFVKLVLIAILIASPIAWWAMNNWLSNYAYRIQVEWWTFALAGLTTIAVALLTVCVQAIKSAVANPVDSLRDE